MQARSALPKSRGTSAAGFGRGGSDMKWARPSPHGVLAGAARNGGLGADCLEHCNRSSN